MSLNGGGADAISAQQQSYNTASIGSHAPNAKANRAVSQPVDSHSVSRRLQSELMSLMTCGDPGISAFPEGDNIFSWIGTIKGGRSTVYEGLSYKLGLKFPTDYPFKPPGVKFDTACFHPNVDQYGNICLDILQDKWSSAYDVRTVLLSIQSLLGEPNNDSPLNSYAAALWNNQEGILYLTWGSHTVVYVSQVLEWLASPGIQESQLQAVLRWGWSYCRQ